MPDDDQHSERPSEAQRATVRAFLPADAEIPDDVIDAEWREYLRRAPWGVAHQVLYRHLLPR